MDKAVTIQKVLVGADFNGHVGGVLFGLGEVDGVGGFEIE